VSGYDRSDDESFYDKAYVDKRAAMLRAEFLNASVESYEWYTVEELELIEK